MRDNLSHRYSLILVFFLAFAFSAPAFAQTDADRLTRLSVDLWPDYDQPAMLVLLTGELPAGTSLPATVTIPLPDDADLHAVARFGDTGGLFSDLEYTVDSGQLTFTTMSPRFRVEYYAPYQVEGSTHSYQFDWRSDLAIDAVTTIVQQPLAAETITIEPEPAGSELRTDNLMYYTLPTQSLNPDQLYTVRVGYEVTTPQLSAAALTTPSPVETPARSTGSGNTLWWVLGLIAAAALVAGAFYLGRGSAGSGRKPKPRPVRPEKPTASSRPPATVAGRFCHNCGQQAEPGDVFCRSCGTKLKS